MPRSITLLIGLGFFLFTSCETEPVNVDVGPAGHNLETQHCPVDNSFTHRSHGSLGYSSTLYLGTVDSTRQSAILLNIKSSTLANFTTMCDLIPADSIEFVSGKLTLFSRDKMEFTTARDSAYTDSLYSNQQEYGPDEGNITPVAHDQSLRAYLINHDELSLEWDESLVFEFTDSLHVTLGSQVIDLLDPAIGIELPVEINRYSVDILFSLDSDDSENSLIEQLMPTFCDQSTDRYSILLVETEPQNEIAFYSSNYPYNSTWPHLNLEYKTYSEIDSIIVKYEIEDVTSSQADIFAATEDPFTSEWGRIIALDTTGFSPIIDENELLSNVVLTTLKIDPVNSEMDTTNHISFYFSNATLAYMDFDPSRDNYQFRDEYDVEDSTLTEGNAEYDYGELFDDCGWDNICNPDEPGYNASGTELNGAYNEGEIFYDTGVDSLWSWEEAGYDPVENPDPSGDDFNIDPAEDNWRDCGLDRLCEDDPGYIEPDPGEQNDEYEAGEGEENNGMYDFGEVFQDTGIDGLFNINEIGYHSIDNPDPNNDDYDPINNPGGTELDGEYSLGEPYLDAGEDGLWSPDEPGYNLTGTENNLAYDYGELFDDTGEDQLWSADEDGYDPELSPDPSEDDYNIDPNEDDYNSETGLGSEDDGLLEWSDTGDLDGIWNEGEGEQWYDWGIDQLPDSLETYYGGNRLFTDLGSNYYQWNYSETPDTSFESWDIADGYDAAIWISGIESNDDGTAEVEISTFSNKLIHGFQLQLVHYPFVYQDTILTEKSLAIRTIEDSKIIDDVSLFSPKSLSDDELETQTAVNYSEQLFAVLDLPALTDFLAENPDAVISKADLILHIDTLQTQFYDDVRIIVEQLTELYSVDADSLSSEPVPDYNPFKDVTAETDSVIISVKSAIQDYISGNSMFNGFILRTDDVDHNFSTLVIRNEMDADSTKHPRLELLYSK